jgi:regulator of protease activity HflC (stomatin/prohibitin superfamily)
VRSVGVLPWTLLLLAYLLSSFRIVRRAHRMALLRFGRLVDIRKPGLRWINPIFDRPIDINLPLEIPEWRHLTERRIVEIIIEIVERRRGKPVR